MKLKNIIFLTYVVIAIPFVATGCKASASNNISQSLQNNASVTQTVPKVYERNTLYSQPEIIDKGHAFQNKVDNNNERARKIKSTVQTLHSIEKASVVVVGRSVIIGIQLSDIVKDNEVSSVKKEVEQLVRTIDATITNVSVTTAPELMSRITNLAGDKEQGKPIDMTNDDLSNLTRTITPTI